MKPFDITTFKFGLDSRRDVLSSQAGTLVTCENAFINSGGEVEKRKKFLEFADVSIFDNNTTAISALTATGDFDPIATATSNGHDLANGDLVKVSGATQTAYNGEFVVFNVTTNTFDYRMASLPASPATGSPVFADMGVFGLLSTEDGLTVFGSALVFGSTPDSRAEKVLEAAIPAGVTYQQLRHPSLYYDTTEVYARLRHRMVKVVFAENFNGKAFVCAEFGDGRKVLFYDGDVVADSVNGVAMTGRTDLADLATDLARQIEEISGWDATANVDEDDITQNGAVVVKSPVQDYFEAIAEETAANGMLGVKQILDASGAPLVDGVVVPAVRAIAKFKVTGSASGTIQLQAPAQKTATTPLVDLCGGAVSVVIGLAQSTAEKIAKYVNDLTSVHGYSAKHGPDANVFIFAPEEFDLNPPYVSIQLTVTDAGGAVTGATTATVDGLTAAITPNPANRTVGVLPGGSGNVFVTVSATAVPSGGSGVYTYAWSERTLGSGGNISIESGTETSPTAIFSALIPHPTSGAGVQVVGQFKCLVSSGGDGIEAFVTVRLELEWV